MSIGGRRKRSQEQVFQKSMKLMESADHRRSLFEEMMFLNNKVYFEDDTKELTMEPKKPLSLWTLFLDAVQRYPRLKKLKDIIERSKIEKSSYDQMMKQRMLEDYIIKKQHEKIKMQSLNKLQRHVRRHSVDSPLMPLAKADKFRKNQLTPMRKSSEKKMQIFGNEENMVHDEEQLKAAVKRYLEKELK